MKHAAVMQGQKLTVDGMSHIAAVSLPAASSLALDEDIGL
ncbi:hypothetical protein GGD66_002685 [Bradyrhizobium sp. CIR48]|nr:hypothetical protein [Bradyrhizobium sp. ERR14]MBB4424141.1 hypothetical protein [Bradyrhizobium sp. CIR48]NYG45107.1 hypothetical protein [Bradyrhizobium sp. IAR9]